MNQKLLLISGLLFVNSLLSAQDNVIQDKNQDLKLAGYNIGFGIITACIGSLVNKPKNVSVWQCLINTSWQGAIGGSLQYAGKSLTYQVNRDQNFLWGWSSKLVHSAGTSISRNAARGNAFGTDWTIDYGPARVNIHNEKGNLKFHPQYNLFFTYDLVQGLSDGKLDVAKTVKTGTFTFVSNKENIQYRNTNVKSRTFTSSMKYAGLNQSSRVYQVIATELVHVYQMEEFHIMNSYLDPYAKKIKGEKLKKILKYINPDIPLYYGFYETQYSKDNNSKNIFEVEASFLSTRKMPK